MSRHAVFSNLSKVIQPLVQDYPSIINIPVQWGEQDTFGHLNNVIYFRYAESGRMAFFLQVMRDKLTPQQFNELITGNGIGPIVKSLNIRYRAPVHFPDTLAVATRIKEIRTDTFDMDYIMVSHEQKKIVAQGICEAVMYDYHKKSKTPIPRYLLDALH